MNDLKERIALGARANNAYNSYIKHLILEAKSEIVQDFEDYDAELDDAEEVLFELKGRLELWKYIDERIQSDINTGKIAEKELEALGGI